MPTLLVVVPRDPQEAEEADDDRERRCQPTDQRYGKRDRAAIQPDDYDTHLNLSACYYGLGKLDLAAGVDVEIKLQ